MIRLAVAEDIPALVTLINRAYRIEDFFVIGDRTNDADVRARMQAPHACFLVVDDEEPGRLAASVYLVLRGDRGYFGMLAVDPERQKRGFARQLITAIEERCRAAGCQALDMDIVSLRSELPAFYAQFGFTAVGTAPFAPAQKLRAPAHLILMTKAL